MSSLLFLTLLCLLQGSYAEKGRVPVLMLDYGLVMRHIQIEPNPFTKLSYANFSDIIHDSTKRSAGIVIFVEENFSAEDISTKDSFGTPYKLIHNNLVENIDKVKYFPSVVEPYKTLSQIFRPQRDSIFYASEVPTNTKLRLSEKFKHLYVFFKDKVNETKAEALRRHDLIISEVLATASRLKSGPIIAFYTGKVNPVVVHKVEYIKDRTTASLRKSGVFIVSPKALFRLFGVHTITQTRRSALDRPPVVLEEVATRQALTTRISYDNFDLIFGFSFPQESWWKLEFVAIYEGDEEVGRTKLGVQVPNGKSYYCTEPISVVNSRDLSTITISEYHIEPKNSSSEDKFGPSIHCTPYFTCALMACLMVTFMCLGILVYGIMTLYDCGRNDRFEDPNSKPLTHETMH